MNVRRLLILVTASLLIAACSGGDDTADPPSSTTTVVPDETTDPPSSTTTVVPDETTEPPADETTDPPSDETMDVERLIAKLQAAGATVTSLDEKGGFTFFSGDESTICVNGESVRLIEYENVAAREGDSQAITPDGQISAPDQAVMVDWVAPPHFYADGRIIALYVGYDVAIGDLLDRTLGSTLSPLVDPTPRDELVPADPDAATCADS